jgi:hypothetical protein
MRNEPRQTREQKLLLLAKNFPAWLGFGCVPIEEFG